MRATGVNRFATYALLFLAVVPVVVLAGAILQGPQAPKDDEGTAAHLFQIAVGLQLPFGLFYAATADWS